MKIQTQNFPIIIHFKTVNFLCISVKAILIHKYWQHQEEDYWSNDSKMVLMVWISGTEIQNVRAGKDLQYNLIQFFHFYRWENWGSKRFHQHPVTQDQFHKPRPLLWSQHSFFDPWNLQIDFALGMSKQSQIVPQHITCSAFKPTYSTKTQSKYMYLLFVLDQISWLWKILHFSQIPQFHIKADLKIKVASWRKQLNLA